MYSAGVESQDESVSMVIKATSAEEMIFLIFISIFLFWGLFSFIIHQFIIFFNKKRKII